MEHSFQGPLPNGRQGADHGAQGRPKNLLTAKTKKLGLSSVQTQLHFQPQGKLSARLRKGEKSVPPDINFERKLNQNQGFPLKSDDELFQLEARNLKMQMPSAGVLEKRTTLRSSTKNAKETVPLACQTRSAPAKTPAPRAKPVALTFEPNESKFCKVVQHAQIGTKESLDPTLAAMQRIYGQVLPGMKYETGRILRNWDYTSIVVTGQQVMGGCTFRYHRCESMIELTLLGVAWSCQEYGLGSSIIESLKLHASVKDFSTIVTYADNNAITFFKKQGFEPLESTHESFEVVKKTIVTCVKSTLMHVAVPLKVQPTETETLRQLPNNTLMEIKPMSLTLSHSQEEAMELETSEQTAAQQIKRELSRCRTIIDKQLSRQASVNENSRAFLLKLPDLIIEENSAEDTQLHDETKLDNLLLSPEEPEFSKVPGLIDQPAVKINSPNDLKRQHSVFFTRQRTCRTAMKQPLVLPTAEDKDQQDVYEDDEILASPFGYNYQFIEEPEEPEKPLELNDADEIYPSDIDMLSDQDEQSISHFFRVHSDQVICAPELEPMFPCQDLRTEVFLNEPNFAKYKSIITQDKTTNLNSSFILGAEIDEIRQTQVLSKEEIITQYIKSIQSVVLPRSETFKHDFILNSGGDSANESKEIVLETPIRRKVIEDLDSLPVIVQKQRQEYFEQLQTRSKDVTVDVSNDLKRSNQFSSFYKQNGVTGKKELQIQTKERVCDFLDLDKELLGDCNQDVGNNLSARRTKMPQVWSINKLLQDRLAVRHAEEKENPKNQLKNDFNRQNSKNTVNSLDTTCMGTTPENTEVQVAPVVIDSKLDFKDIKIFKTIVFDIFIQHENKLKELTRPSLADCFLVGWSKKALISAQSNTEQKVADLITMCQIQPTLCLCVGSATKQPDLEPSFDLWRKRDVKTFSKL